MTNKNRGELGPDMAHPAAEAVYVPTTNKRDEILFKCKQAIENLHHEVLNQKQMNSELQT